MKKFLFFIILALFVFPMSIYAIEDIEYNVCRDGCEYSEVDAVFGAIDALRSNNGYNITINIMDKDVYYLNNYSYVYRYRSVWQDGELHPVVTNLVINGNGATIVSNTTHNDGNFVPRGLILCAQTEVRVNDLKIDTGDNSVLFQSYKNSVFLNNVEVNSVFTLNNSSIISINDCTINGEASFTNASIDKLSVKGSIALDRIVSVNNVNIEGSMYLMANPSEESLSIKNFEIDAKGYEYGLILTYDVCGGEIGSYYLENVNIKNASVSGILYNRSRSRLYVNNCNLSDNSCSIDVSSRDMAMCLISHIGKPRVELLKYEESNADAVFKNTSVSCAITRFEDISSLSSSYIMDNMFSKVGVLYFDSSNIWTKNISRGNSVDENNIVELDDGRIVLEIAKEETINIKVDNIININSYFGESENENINWVVEDESILVIKNNVIIPKKIGKTNIYGEIDDNIYSLHVEITGEDLVVNPKTNSILYMIILFVFLSLSFVIIKITNKKTS